MADIPEIPGMWINPKSNFKGKSHPSSYGEGQNSHNSRFLELADVLFRPQKAVSTNGAPITGGSQVLPITEKRKHRARKIASKENNY